jgi:hypothetical protein
MVRPLWSDHTSSLPWPSSEGPTHAFASLRNPQPIVRAKQERAPMTSSSNPSEVARRSFAQATISAQFMIPGRQPGEVNISVATEILAMADQAAHRQRSMEFGGPRRCAVISQFGHATQDGIGSWHMSWNLVVCALGRPGKMNFRPSRLQCRRRDRLGLRARTFDG